MGKQATRLGRVAHSSEGATIMGIMQTALPDHANAALLLKQHPEVIP